MKFYHEQTHELHGKANATDKQINWHEFIFLVVERSNCVIASNEWAQMDILISSNFPRNMIHVRENRNRTICTNTTLYRALEMPANAEQYKPRHREPLYELQNTTKKKRKNSFELANKNSNRKKTTGQHWNRGFQSNRFHIKWKSGMNFTIWIFPKRFDRVRVRSMVLNGLHYSLSQK